MSPPAGSEFMAAGGQAPDPHCGKRAEGVLRRGTRRKMTFFIDLSVRLIGFSTGTKYGASLYHGSRCEGLRGVWQERLCVAGVFGDGGANLLCGYPAYLLPPNKDAYPDPAYCYPSRPTHNASLWKIP